MITSINAILAFGVVYSAALIFPVATCSDAEKVLKVKVEVNYTQSVSFSYEPPFYRAGSSLTLICNVEGAEEDSSGLLYEWRSTCKGNCFVRSGHTKSVSTRYLHSYDSGEHTCVVYDRGGCTGNASTTVNVTGAGVYVESPRNEAISNNSMIVEVGTSLLRLPHFRGLSASTSPHVGQLIDPYGNDITTSTSDPFIVTLGSSFEPGTMRVRSFRSLRRSEEGIYTYRTPDNTGNNIDVYFGLYSSTLAKQPAVTNLTVSLGGKIPFQLSCFSQDSPPTEVIWEKDGQRIHLNGSKDGYRMTQVLLNKLTSSYVNSLTMDGMLDDVVGEYSCTVVNSLGSSNTMNTTINPITITGHESPIIVGLSGTINCTTVLNASKLEWILVGIGTGDPVEETDQGQSLVLSLSPEATELNGAKLTCRVTTVNHQVFEETITVTIKELENIVAVQGPSTPIPVGRNATYTCVITSDFVPTLQWLDKLNNPVTTSGDSVWTLPQYTIGSKTYMKLNFNPVKSSHGGSYTCKSVITHSSSTNSTSRRVLVKLSQESDMKQPPKHQHFTGQPLTLTCWTHIDDSVDTPVAVTHNWIGPGGNIRTDSRKTVTGVIRSNMSCYSQLIFSYLRSSDSGSYHCQSTLHASSNYSYHSFISSSDSETESTTINAVIQVNIRISYSSPDPGYSPPNYRAASSVTLTCVAVGVTGSVSYRWSSTCSSCFASSSSSSAISKTYLVARDTGVHTCTVTDGAANRGSTNTTMNIVGAGIYVSYSRGTGYISSTGPQPNNSYAFVDTGRSDSSSSNRFMMYCCSSSRYTRGSVIYPNGYSRRSNYGNDVINAYSSSHNLAGCIQFYQSYYYRSSFYPRYYGVYTCNFGNEFVSISLYSQGGAVSRIYVSPLQRSSWSSLRPSSLVITTTTYYSPPSTITWYRNNETIDTTNENTSVTTYITNRRSSYYKILLSLKTSPDNVVGNYSATIGNAAGTRTAAMSSSITGIQMVCNSTKFIVGQAVNCTCSSDLQPTSIEWYKQDQSLPFCSQNITRYSRSFNGVSSVIIIPGTDDYRNLLTCVTNTLYGSQNESVIMDIEIPNNWAILTEQLTGEPLHNNNFTITCNVRAIDGMNLPISMQWLFPNGSEVTNYMNKTVGNVSVTSASYMEHACQSTYSQRAASEISMMFHPVVNSDGGTYSCQASINVPWTRGQNKIINKPVLVAVTTQAIFQLKIFPVTHCSTWDTEKALSLEQSVKSNLEEAVSSRCNCPFLSTRIHHGEFSCQPKTCSSDGECGPSSSAITAVTYRAIVNGTSDLMTADQVIGHIDAWREDTGSFLHYMFRLRMYTQKECELKINSFYKTEC